MAVFMLNVCKFNACGLTFKSLGHLIQHIEETHIDYDPHVVEQSEQQQPTCIPLSYALRFLTDAARQEGLKPIQHGRAKQTNFASPNRNKNVTPTGSEAEEGEDLTSEPEDSNDSWTTSEEFSADYILRYGSRVVSQSITTHTNNTTTTTTNNNNNSNSNNNNNNSINNMDKPFACPVPGCKKRYKNVNGIKYHSKNGHKNDGKIRKAFKCSCGKSYKTTYGLKNHAAMQHNSSITGLNIKTTIHSNKQQHQQLSKGGNENENIISTLDIVAPLKISKTKIPPAIEDHGYIKSERSILTGTEIECDNDLGILTPASTPPLALHNMSKGDQQHHQQQQQPIVHQVRTVNKYFTTTSNNVNNSSRRSINNNNNNNNNKNDY